MTQITTTNAIDLGWNHWLLQALLTVTLAAGLVGQLAVSALWLDN